MELWIGQGRGSGQGEPSVGCCHYLCGDREHLEWISGRGDRKAGLYSRVTCSIGCLRREESAIGLWRPFGNAVPLTGVRGHREAWARGRGQVMKYRVIRAGTLLGPVVITPGHKADCSLQTGTQSHSSWRSLMARGDPQGVGTLRGVGQACVQAFSKVVSPGPIARGGRARRSRGQGGSGCWPVPPGASHSSAVSFLRGPSRGLEACGGCW